MLHTVKLNVEGFTNRQVADANNAWQAYDMVGRPSPCDFAQIVSGNMI